MSPLHWLAGLCVILTAALAALYFQYHQLKHKPHKFTIRRPPEEVEAEAPVKPEDEDYQLGEVCAMLPLLQEYGITHLQTMSREDLAKAVLKNACRVARSRNGAVLLWNEERRGLETAATTGPAMSVDETTAENAFTLSQTLASRSTEGKPLITIPIMALSKPQGILQLESHGFWGEIQNVAFGLLAGEAAALLHQLELFNRLQVFHIEMVETLYRTINARDPMSKAHAEQTRSRARQVAIALKMPPQMVQHVEYAALLRGVGKIGIDQTILNKPGKLSPKEYDEIKKHTTIGHQILAQVKLLAPTARMVLYSQEWFNGRGYPEGLKGEEIPMGARIIAVISAWEAMTSDRPYRKALTLTEASDELRRAAGTQFDPAVVEAFLQVESAAQAGAA